MLRPALAIEHTTTLTSEIETVDISKIWCIMIDWVIIFVWFRILIQFEIETIKWN